MWGSIHKHFATNSAIQVWVCRVWTVCPFPKNEAENYHHWKHKWEFSNNPDSELARTKVSDKGPYLPMSSQSQGSDSVLATEQWQLQGASQYSALCFTKLMHTHVSGTQRISRTLNVISYPKQACKFITTKFSGTNCPELYPTHWMQWIARKM